MKQGPFLYLIQRLAFLDLNCYFATYSADYSDDVSSNDSGISHLSTSLTTHSGSDNGILTLFIQYPYEFATIICSQIEADEDDHLPPGFSEAFRLLEIKSHSTMSSQVYREIVCVFTDQHISLYHATKKLASIVSIEPVWVDCCINSCYALTGVYSKATCCPKCQQTQYSCKKMAFFPLKDQFIIQYNDKHHLQELQYWHEYVTSIDYQEKRQYGNIFDGNRYKELVEDEYFSDSRDIALMASLDGYQILKQKTDDYWIIMPTYDLKTA